MMECDVTGTLAELFLKYLFENPTNYTCTMQLNYEYF